MVSGEGFIAAGAILRLHNAMMRFFPSGDTMNRPKRRTPSNHRPMRAALAAAIALALALMFIAGAASA
jgi:hypothetical protein